MIIGLGLVFGGCAMGVAGLSLIAAGDPPQPSPSTKQKAQIPVPSSPVTIAQDEPVNNSIGNITGNTGIITNNQTGGTNTINNYGPQAPRYEVLGELPIQKNPDGTFRRVLVINVITAVPANNLFVMVKKAEIVGGGAIAFSVSPWDGISQATNGYTDDSMWTKVAAPTSGRYTIQMKVRDPDAKPVVTIAFNQ